MKLLNLVKQISPGGRIAIALAVGLIVGSLGTVAFQAYNPKDVIAEGPKESVSAIFGRIVNQNKMISASQDYTFVEKAVDKNRLFDIVDIPFTENSFWYRYTGTIEATVDLSDASLVKKNETTLVISLPEPVLSNKPNMDLSGVLEERNNLLNPIHVSDVDELQRDCIAMSNNEAEKNGLLKAAKEATVCNLQQMYDIALGENEYKVEVEWIDNAEVDKK
ncbi:MAG: DUF4230 domain-containing protein [Coriobacteriaceae bacterium]|nr:DUF4230 domain-containing protein [Coriobacteriaceae bacterium]